MLRFFSRFQADFQLKCGWIEPRLVGGYAPFSPRNTYDIEVTSDVIKRFSLKNAIKKINSISKFEENGKYGLIYKADDEIVLRPIYDDIKPFSEGLAAIQQNTKWGFVNKLGEIIVSPKYLHVENFAYGYAKV